MCCYYYCYALIYIPIVMVTEWWIKTNSVKYIYYSITDYFVFHILRLPLDTCILFIHHLFFIPNSILIFNNLSVAGLLKKIFLKLFFLKYEIIIVYTMMKNWPIVISIKQTKK